MRSAKLFILLSFFCLHFCGAEISAQKRKSKHSKKVFVNKDPKKKIVSFGLINGKAVNLVKPEYSATARFVKVQGTVSIEVLIDENGKVIKASAVRGHPLLIPTSLKAAQNSNFEPIVLHNAQALKVSGIIVYNYVSDSMNWLELGFYSDSFEKLSKYLPLTQERELLRQSENLVFDEKMNALQTVQASVESSLGADLKSAWLFSVGESLKDLSNHHWKPEIKQEMLEKIQNMLFSKPENISPLLIKNLEILVETKNAGEFNKIIIIITENLYRWGN